MSRAREPRAWLSTARIPALLIVAGLVAAPVGFAATVRGLSLADLVRESDAVIRGRAVSERPFRHPRLGIVRAVEVAVDERLVGDCGARVEVLLLGGEIDGAGTYVPGEADLAVGDEALLFLSMAAGGAGTFRVVGLSQGMFFVLRDPVSGRAFAARDLGAIDLIGSPDDDDLGLSRACTSTFLPLERLESMVVDLASGAGI